MATAVHALYCFEILNASLRHRTPLSLSQVEEYYDQYLSSLSAISAQAKLDTVQQADGTEDEDVDVTTEEEDVQPMRTQLLSPSPSRQNAPSPSTTGSSTPSTPQSSNGSSSTSISSSRSSLNSRLHNLRSNARGKTSSPAPIFPSHPMFITWNIKGRFGSKNLRGCIGTFDPQPLDSGLHSYALTSAYEDTRFMPISLSELPHLDCSITLLTDFEPAPTPMSWDIGTHGLRIAFTHHGKRYGSTYLPDVAKEQGWTKQETMVSLMRKAGWNGRKDEWQRVQDLSVTRYQGLRVGVEYEDWRTWRDWVAEHAGATAVLN